MNTYLYIAIMAATTYAIRVLPLTPPLPKRALLLMQRKNEPLSLAAKAFCHVLRAGSGC